VMAPPSFQGWPIESGFDMYQLAEELVKAGAPRGDLDGGVEYEFIAPVGAGDVLVAITKIADIRGIETKMGPTMAVVVETTFTNQRGAVACIMRNTGLFF